MKQPKDEFPLKIEIGFQKLLERYENLADSKNEVFRSRAERVLELAKKYPKLRTGLSTEAQVRKFKKQIDLLFEDLFPSVLGTNEIKIASVPYREIIFKSSERYKNILDVAGDKFTGKLSDFSDELNYVMGCSIILMFYYGFRIDFRRPTYYHIPDANGIMRYYRVMYNADFTEIVKTDKAPEITQEDVDLLLENFENVAIWKEKFPPESYIFKGFVIASLFDVTSDVSISNFKTSLLKSENNPDSDEMDFQGIFQSIFNLPSLKVGYTDYNEEDETFEMAIGNPLESTLLDGQNILHCQDALCDVSYYKLFKQNEAYVVTNTPKYHKLYPDNVLYKKLAKQGVKSAIFAAIVNENKVQGILELTSPNINELNTVNAVKLKDIMPFLVESVVRTKQRFENEVELLIQNECTSIHKSVHWKFRKEAKRVLKKYSEGNQANFRELVFDDVYPLFGQVDIKGSSMARNIATKQDLLLQLDQIQKMIRKIYKIEALPIYEQINFRIKKYIKDLKEDFKVDSERQVLSFLRKEIIPLFDHLKAKSEPLAHLVAAYNESVEENTGLIYHHRKDYDEAVMAINKKLASLLDAKQSEAQQMYPHYFERFKTDGIEHNLYIGESITKHENFNKVYLYNLRLWQLQVMCEMENSYYQMKEALPVSLDVASMILVFNSSLSLRFRMDEKRFDVDGTYNARYEVVKKRVDKAHVKGTEERITQPGKITIIYSQKSDEKEYLKYISFLQSKKQLDKDVEILRVEDLQGVSGLKAIRVSVLYTSTKNDSKEYYTYEDLMKELKT